MFTKTPFSQSGNVLIAIFAAIAAVGVLGVVGMNVVRGPVTTMSHVTRHTIAENDMLAAAILISEASLAQANADCDADGMIEPVPFADAGAQRAPSGGGLIPMSIGAKKTDPWGGAYGYCAWDHGSKVKDNACGVDANRLSGGDTSTAPVIAVISAGPDRLFQTDCTDWIDNDTDLVSRPAESDDVMHIMPYGQFLLPARARAQLENLPDEACHTETIGTMRLQEGAVQVCTDVGWTEVGTSAFADSNFEPITDAILNYEYTTPNVLTFQGFLNRRDVAVTEGAAILIINGTPAGTQTTIAAGDTIALRATSAPVPETTYTFAISVGGVRKVWTIRTRDFTPTNLTITPTSQPMTINTPGTPGYGDVYPFIVRNIGEVESGPLLTSQLSNTTNFEFYAGGSYHGDECAGANLGANGFCVIDVRPRAHDEGTYTGTLTARTATLSAQADLSINATGWSCPVPWGGGTIPHNGELLSWQSASVAWDGTCQSETRRCTFGELSGSFTNQNCTATTPLDCPTAPGGALAHGQHRDYYAAASVPCTSSCSAVERRTCTNGVLSGSYTAATCSVQACPQGYFWYSSRTASGLPLCSSPNMCAGGVTPSTTYSYRCTGINGNYPQGSYSSMEGKPVDPVCRSSCQGNTFYWFCNANPKILCAYFNSIGLLPDHIYAADLRYAQQFVPDDVNRGYRLWAVPLTAYLERNPHSILVPILRPLVVGWAEEMAYRMGEVEESNWVGRVLIKIGTPLSKAIARVDDMTSGEAHSKSISATQE